MMRVSSQLKKLQLLCTVALIFNKNHPILKTINNLIANIDNDRYKNDLINFSVKPIGTL